jgi:uncharacterized alkaline shock family protein YloU
MSTPLSIKMRGKEMNEVKNKVDVKKVDTKEFELPETVFIRDIENKVFQGIVLQCLSQIEGISLVEGNLIDSLLGRSTLDSGIKGIYIEQDNKNHSVSIKVELNMCYGYTIPDKAEEIQTKITEDVTKLTGLHVSCVHVVVKNVISAEQAKRAASTLESGKEQPILTEGNLAEDYTEEF